MNKGRLPLFLCGIALASCATATNAGAQSPSESAVERRIGELRRIHEVAARVKSANLGSCPTRASWLGASFATVADLGKDVREVARGVVSDRPQPIWIAASGPAARAGLQTGDRLVAVNGAAVAAGSKAGKSAARLIRKGLDQGPVTLRVERGGTAVELVVPPEETCGYDVRVEDNGGANAYADGRDIHVFRGLLDAVESDDELALVISHELAHNTMNHLGKQTKNATADVVPHVAAAYGGSDPQGTFGKLGAQKTRGASAQEFEADYVGMYYLAAAGYRLDAAEAFWRRLAAEDPDPIRKAGGHPSAAARYAGIHAAREEIAQKLEAGQPLRPDQ